MKFRPVRGSLQTAMEEVQECEPTMESLKAAMKRIYGGFMPTGEITLKLHGYDDRIGWDTYLVCEDGKACGYTDGPLAPDATGDPEVTDPMSS